MYGKIKRDGGPKHSPWLKAESIFQIVFRQFIEAHGFIEIANWSKGKTKKQKKISTFLYIRLWKSIFNDKSKK